MLVDALWRLKLLSESAEPLRCIIGRSGPLVNGGVTGAVDFGVGVGAVFATGMRFFSGVPRGS